MKLNWNCHFSSARRSHLYATPARISDIESKRKKRKKQREREREREGCIAAMVITVWAIFLSLRATAASNYLTCARCQQIPRVCIRGAPYNRLNKFANYSARHGSLVNFHIIDISRCRYTGSSWRFYAKIIKCAHAFRVWDTRMRYERRKRIIFLIAEILEQIRRFRIQRLKSRSEAFRVSGTAKRLRIPTL